MKFLSILNQKGTTYLTGGSSGTKFYYSSIPEKFIDFIEVSTSINQSMFTAVTVTADDLIVSSYLYDDKTGSVILYETFGFTRFSPESDIYSAVCFFLLMLTVIKNYVTIRKRKVVF